MLHYYIGPYVYFFFFIVVVSQIKIKVILLFDTLDAQIIFFLQIFFEKNILSRKCPPSLQKSLECQSQGARVQP
jgi:hypothetical protein